MAVKKTSASAKTVAKTAAAPSSGVDAANLPAATEFDPSGAPLQDSGSIDPKHPAVDNDPRAGTSKEQNQIDFNDPTLSGAKAVEQNLKNGE